MTPTLETERLRLRPARAEDAPGIAQHANDFDVVRMTSSMPYPYTLADAQDFVSGGVPETYQWIIADIATDAPLGAISLREGEVSGDMRTCGAMVIGYWLGKAFWGRGYAVEAGRAALAALFSSTDAEAVHAQAFAENAGSLRVLEKLGFARVGAGTCHSRARAEACAGDGGAERAGAGPSVTFALSRAAFERMTS